MRPRGLALNSRRLAARRPAAPPATLRTERSAQYLRHACPYHDRAGRARPVTPGGGAFGAILEVMTWVGFVLGLPLLAWGWLSLRRRCQWAQTTGTVISAGGFTGYGWTDHNDADHRSLLPAA